MRGLLRVGQNLRRAAGFTVTVVIILSEQAELGTRLPSPISQWTTHGYLAMWGRASRSRLTRASGHLTPAMLGGGRLPKRRRQMRLAAGWFR
jgi:hypothetical protein